MPNIRHEVIIGATAQEIYKTISSPEGLRGWWTPETDFEPDNLLRFSFGPVYSKVMKIVILEPFALVKWDCVDGAEEWIGTSISFQLHEGNREYMLQSHPEATGQIQQQNSEYQTTLVVFEHDGWKSYTPMFAECNYTWGQFLRSLKLLCETGKGRPWPHQHR